MLPARVTFPLCRVWSTAFLGAHWNGDVENVSVDDLTDFLWQTVQGSIASSSGCMRRDAFVRREIEEIVMRLNSECA